MVSSKENDYFFSRLLRWEKTASLNAAFCALLEQDFRVAFSAVKTHPAQELTAMSLIGAAYQHFGFVVFGPLGRVLAGTQIASLSGLDASAITQWLELVAYNLLEDLNVLQVVSGEPDWGQVDLSLSMELWKRLFCSDENEASSLGLDCLDDQEIARLRKLALKAVSLMGSGKAEEGEQAEVLMPLDLCESHVRTFRTIAASAAGNPIMLLLWRIEVFSLLKETRHEHKFRLKVEADNLLPMLTALAGVLMVLSPVAVEAGAPLFPESPLSIEEIEYQLGIRKLRRSASAPVVGELPHMKVLRQWIGNGSRNIDEVLSLGCSYGLIFAVSLRPRKTAYGLTVKGSQTLAPFITILGELLCPSPVSPGRSASAETSAQTKTSKTKDSKAKKRVSQGEKASFGADGFMNELSKDLVQAEGQSAGAQKKPQTTKAKPGDRP